MYLYIFGREEKCIDSVVMRLNVCGSVKAKEILKYIKQFFLPKEMFHRDSPTFLKIVNLLSSNYMSGMVLSFEYRLVKNKTKNRHGSSPPEPVS